MFQWIMLTTRVSETAKNRFSQSHFCSNLWQKSYRGHREKSSCFVRGGSRGTFAKENATPASREMLTGRMGIF